MTCATPTLHGMKHAEASRTAGPSRSLSRISDALTSIAQRTAARAFALDAIWSLHKRLSGSGTPAEFAGLALKDLEVHFELDPAQLERIPATGSAVVVANHPFGGLEGLFLVATLMRLRPDVKVLANQMLSRIPELESVFIPVNPFGGPRAASFNVTGLRQALRHVHSGGLLVLFPAGEVSHFYLGSRCVVDPPWHPTAARLVRSARCDVVPVHFGGNNSAVFQIAGLLHPLLRTALLPREFLNKRHRRLQVTIGAAIKAARIASQSDDAALASLLRISTYSLSESKPGNDRHKPARHSGPIAPETPSHLVAAEIQALPATQTLLKSGDLRVVYATANQLPKTLQEVGRLREITFRNVGEGTGHQVDLDIYDDYYVHLLAWNDTTLQIVGGYRIGHADEIAAQLGARGLYCHSLFAFGKALLSRLGPALELGRSFIRIEYQRNYAPLLLLWRGISAYVIRHPRYRVLFGPVSISNDYRGASRELLVQYLRTQCFDTGLSRLIRPRRALHREHTLGALGADVARLTSLEDIVDLISGIEPDGKGVPVLLRQYLKIGGRLIGFNVDDRFSHAIDGLIIVDLPTLDKRTLERYMGRDEAAAYLQHHQQPHAEPVAGAIAS